ncbi:MAG TPA: hypothetical protein V6D47_10240 [Oscillatoriaceae cyanobacterium]
MRVSSWIGIGLLSLCLSACATHNVVAPTALETSGGDGAMQAAAVQLSPTQRKEAADAAAIHTFGAPATPSEAQLDALRALLPRAEALIGAKLAFKDDSELVPYLASLAHALPVSSYDPQGYLHGLGIENPVASGRTDNDTFAAVRQIKSYTVGITIGTHELASQAMAYNAAFEHPETYAAAAVVLNPMLEAYSRLRALWRRRFVPAQKVHPTGLTPVQRYPQAYGTTPAASAYHLLFDTDFHSGEPSTSLAGRTGAYGTYNIALRLGFSDDSARRIAESCNDVDFPNKTPYGHTEPLPFGSMDRHFNLDRHGEDTRYVWAQRHFQAALSYASQTSYNEAEVELGVGLHSLQDSFAHGQLTPCLHGTIGDFPDNVCYNPVGFLEATQATEAYLRRYLSDISATPSP